MDFRLNLATETVAQLDVMEPVCVEPTATVREVFELLQARTGRASWSAGRAC